VRWSRNHLVSAGGGARASQSRHRPPSVVASLAPRALDGAAAAGPLRGQLFVARRRNVRVMWHPHPERVWLSVCRPQSAEGAPGTRPSGVQRAFGCGAPGAAKA
jgi:hypothetical protein